MLGTFSKDILYNKDTFQNRYPNFKHDSLKDVIQKTVDEEVVIFLRKNGST